MFTGAMTPGEAAYERTLVKAPGRSLYANVISAPKTPPVYEVQDVEVTARPFPWVAVGVAALVALILLNSEKG